MVDVEVLTGYSAAAPLEHRGSFRAHATDLNAMVRALELGASFERPGFTFEIVARQPADLAANGRRW